MIKKSKLIFFVVLVIVILSSVIILLQKKNIINLLYHSDLFHQSFNRVNIDMEESTRALNFHLSVGDMQFLSGKKKDTIPGTRAWQGGSLDVTGRRYRVEIALFENYFKEFLPAGTKKSFSIRFPENSYFENVCRYDLFFLEGIDLFEQELIYNLGKQLGLYIPKTGFVQVLFDYSDDGIYIFKQAFDQVFLDQNRLDDAVIFMLNKDENDSYTVNYLYGDSDDEDTEYHLKELLELLKIGDENILFKYFDLDYLLRFETLRRLLKTGIDFVIADNLRYVYNKSNGKLYPLLDEANILNMRNSAGNDSLRNLTDLIEFGPGFYRESTVHIIARLTNRYDSIINFHKKSRAKFRSYMRDIFYRLKIKLVSDYFFENIYKRIKTSGVNREEISPDVLSYPALSKPGDRYLDQLFISPSTFATNNRHLGLVLKKDKMIMQKGDYVLKKNLIIPYGSLLEVSAGTSIKVLPGVSLVSYSPVHINGTGKEPVTIEPFYPGKPFGVFSVVGNTNKESVINFLNFSGSSTAFVSGVFHYGGICIRDMDVKITDSKINNVHSASGLNVTGGSVYLKNNEFNANVADHVNLRSCTGIIEQNRFYHGGKKPANDGLTIVASNVIIKNNLIEKCKDKGIIISQDSKCVLYENIISSNAVGVAVKDSAGAIFFSNRFLDNKIAFSAYQKDPAFAGGYIFKLGNAFERNETGFFYDRSSRLYRPEKTAIIEKKIRELIMGKKSRPISRIFGLIEQTFPDAENMIKSFNVGRYPATINERNKTIFIRLPANSETQQEISFLCSNQNTEVYIIPVLQGIHNHKRGETRKIKNNSLYDFKKYIFHGKVNVKQDYQNKEYHLYITDSKLAIITIDTRNKSGILKEIKNEPKIPCQISYIPSVNNSKKKIVLEEFSAKIEGRGQKWPKWKYGFTLDRTADLEGMKKTKKWVLESSFVDKTLMRSKLAFDLLEQFRDNKSRHRIAPTCKFVEVLLNRDYVGIYLLIEHIDKNFIELEDFDRNEEFNALLYRAANRNANFNPVNTHPNKNNIYKHFPGQIQPALKEKDPIKGWHSGFEQRHPDPEEYGEYWEAIEDFTQFIVFSPAYEFQPKIFEILDRQSFIDLWILIQLIDDTDGVYQNRYIAKHKGKNAKWYIFPWDKDGVLGRNFKMEKRPYNEWLDTRLFRRCLLMESFRKSFIQRWQELVKSGIISTGNLFEMIEQNKEILSLSRERNFQRWPVDDSLYPDSMDFEQEIEYMKTWITNRIEWLEHYIPGLAIEEAE